MNSEAAIGLANYEIVRIEHSGGAVRIGTAMVHPSLLAAVSDVAHPTRRARSLIVYRSWRGFGYAVGAAIAGAVAGALGLAWSIAWFTVRETKLAGCRAGARQP